VAAALFCACPGVVDAHDPGLSALDVRLARDRILVSLSLAASDAKLPAAAEIEIFARDAIVVALDGAPLAVRAARTDRSESGVAVTLEFDRATASRVSIRSDVPGRLANGHRELLTVHAPDGGVVLERLLDAQSGEVAVELATVAGRGRPAVELFDLGLRHILAGYDHLLFLVALLLGVSRLPSVITTVTAFTLAHSVTLSLAVLGFVAVPSAIVEPLIAASIVLVGIENLVRDPGASRWKLTFAFGLVHGFGFAGALRDLGIGADAAGVALPLACFNIGVEAGQIAVVVALWPVLRALNGRPGWRLRFAPATSLAITVAGGYWLIQRTIGG
jgi:hydrogenase/urease accessory protein HupE